ncbi:unnamed protein product [Amoebophrya sp. A120]|nr:unnamed protein product [Amoebophrya sp. A120]|eukprot:GSA120T00000919001.1
MLDPEQASGSGGPGAPAPGGAAPGSSFTERIFDRVVTQAWFFERYDTYKYVRVFDVRLGITYYLFCTLLGVYIGVYRILYLNSQFQVSPVAGDVMITPLTPSVGNCNVDNGFTNENRNCRHFVADTSKLPFCDKYVDPGTTAAGTGLLGAEGVSKSQHHPPAGTTTSAGGSAALPPQFQQKPTVHKLPCLHVEPDSQYYPFMMHQTTAFFVTHGAVKLQEGSSCSIENEEKAYVQAIRDRNRERFSGQQEGPAAGGGTASSLSRTSSARTSAAARTGEDSSEQLISPSDEQQQPLSSATSMHGDNELAPHNDVDPATASGASQFDANGNIRQDNYVQGTASPAARRMMFSSSFAQVDSERQPPSEVLELGEESQRTDEDDDEDADEISAAALSKSTAATDAFFVARSENKIPLTSETDQLSSATRRPRAVDALDAVEYDPYDESKVVHEVVLLGEDENGTPTSSSSYPPLRKENKQPTVLPRGGTLTVLGSADHEHAAELRSLERYWQNENRERRKREDSRRGGEDDETTTNADVDLLAMDDNDSQKPSSKPSSITSRSTSTSALQLDVVNDAAAIAGLQEAEGTIDSTTPSAVLPSGQAGAALKADTNAVATADERDLDCPGGLWTDVDEFDWYAADTRELLLRLRPIFHQVPTDLAKKNVFYEQITPGPTCAPGQAAACVDLRTETHRIRCADAQGCFKKPSADELAHEALEKGLVDPGSGKLDVGALMKALKANAADEEATQPDHADMVEEVAKDLAAQESSAATAGMVNNATGTNDTSVLAGAASDPGAAPADSTGAATTSSTTGAAAGTTGAAPAGDDMIQDAALAPPAGVAADTTSSSASSSTTASASTASTADGTTTQQQASVLSPQGPPPGHQQVDVNQPFNKNAGTADPNPVSLPQNQQTNMNPTAAVTATFPGLQVNSAPSMTAGTTGTVAGTTATSSPSSWMQIPVPISSLDLRESAPEQDNFSGGVVRSSEAHDHSSTKARYLALSTTLGDSPADEENSLWRSWFDARPSTSSLLSSEGRTGTTSSAFDDNNSRDHSLSTSSQVDQAENDKKPKQHVSSATRFDARPALEATAPPGGYNMNSYRVVQQVSSSSNRKNSVKSPPILRLVDDPFDGLRAELVPDEELNAMEEKAKADEDKKAALVREIAAAQEKMSFLEVTGSSEGRTTSSSTGAHFSGAPELSGSSMGAPVRQADPGMNEVMTQQQQQINEKENKLDAATGGAGTAQASPGLLNTALHQPDAAMEQHQASTKKQSSIASPIRSKKVTPEQVESYCEKVKGEGIFKMTNFDYFSVGRILELANVDLDYVPEGETKPLREAGVLIQMDVEWTNLIPWGSSFGYKPISYTYKFRRIPGIEILYRKRVEYATATKLSAFDMQSAHSDPRFVPYDETSGGHNGAVGDTGYNSGTFGDVDTESSTTTSEPSTMMNSNYYNGGQSEAYQRQTSSRRPKQVEALPDNYRWVFQGNGILIVARVKGEYAEFNLSYFCLWMISFVALAAGFQTVLDYFILYILPPTRNYVSLMFDFAISRKAALDAGEELDLEDNADLVAGLEGEEGENAGDVTGAHLPDRRNAATASSSSPALREGRAIQQQRSPGDALRQTRNIQAIRHSGRSGGEGVDII